MTAAKNSSKDPINFLLQPFSSLKRIGEAFEKMLVLLVGKNRLINLLLHRPARIEEILFCPKVFEVPHDKMVILKLKIEIHNKPNNPRQPYKISCYNPTGYVNLVFFRTFPGQMEKLEVGREIAVLGRLQKVAQENQITHPQEIVSAEKIEELPRINVVYPLLQAVTSKFIQNKVTEILNNLALILAREKFHDPIDKNLLKSKNWPSFFIALNELHNPKNESDLGHENKARQRLAYDELLAFQIAMLLARKEEEAKKQLPKIGKNLSDEFLKKMPFKPTNAQLRVISEIKENILSNKKMLRLLQGDVGSGKTIVAIYSCLLAKSCGKQSCVIVPISILADQHFNYFKNLLKDFDIKIEILTSKTTKKQREKLLENLKNGAIDILVGTHAILQDDVIFKNLGLAVIDEQHRFGVMQRLKLVEKGADTDVLLMSATPIPRSLMMAIYGDMSISILDEKPKNRKEIETLIMSENKKSEIYDGVKRAISRGEKVYWLCPLIEENEEILMSDAQNKHKELAQIFGEKNVALLHGKMKVSEKERIMEEFSQSSDGAQILVATTVIEVGIDVKQATIIVIENSENFGLSQLHQLRGRVGRSDQQSYCILLYGKKYGQNAKTRLAIMKESNDGFYIADEDLKLRGSGEFIGTKQSGFPEFLIADLSFDTELLKIAHKNAEIILHKDPRLQNEDSKKYRDLLRLFDYDGCLKIINSG